MVQISKTAGRAVVIVAVVVAALGIGAVALHRHQVYQNKKAQDHQVVVDQQVADVKQAAGAEYDSLLAVYQHERVECEKGRAAYDALTPLAKTKTPAPTCGPAVVQKSGN